MTRRIVLVAAASLSLILVVGVGFWAGQPEYRVLYSNLAPEDASAVVSKLQSLNIPYQLTAGGTTVSVPADQVGRLRIELAGEGLPYRPGKGFELFDESPLGMTPFTQQINYVRALQAELARTIMQIEPVAFARVHITRSEPTPFVRDQKPPTASVVLRLKPGQSLSRSTAAGIVAMVARAVEGLSPENVTLVDARGRILSEPQGVESGVVATQLEYRRALESYLSTKAEDLMGQLLGPGRAIVRVAADINFQRLKERKETVNPEARAVTSEKISNSKSTSSQPLPQGAVGTASNLPSRAANAAFPGSGTTTTQEETIETDYAVSRVIQEFENKFGSIERLTIAALVDLQGTAGTGSPSLTLADAQEIIKQAVGFKSNRDEIKVSDVRLAGAPPPPEEEQVELQRIRWWQQVVAMVRNASLGVAAVVALVLGWMLLRRLQQLAPTIPPTPQVRLRERLATLAQTDPEVLAAVLNSYLEEEGSRR